MAGIPIATRDGLLVATGSAPFTPRLRKNTIQEIIKDKSETWFWEDTFLDNGKWIAMAIENNSFVAVADGSYDPTCGQSLCTAGAHFMCTVTGCIAPASIKATMDDNAGAYRSELTGLYHILALCALVCHAHNVTTGSIQISCDNDGALWRAQPLSTYVPVRSKHSDVVRAIRVAKQDIPVPIRYVQVMGHRDDQIPWHRLTNKEQLNILCDDLAKLRRAQEQDLPTPSREILPHEHMVIRLAGKKISLDPGKAIRQYVPRQEMRQYHAE